MHTCQIRRHQSIHLQVRRSKHQTHFSLVWVYSVCIIKQSCSHLLDNGVGDSLCHAVDHPWKAEFGRSTINRTVEQLTHDPVFVRAFVPSEDVLLVAVYVNGG